MWRRRESNPRPERAGIRLSTCLFALLFSRQKPEQQGALIGGCHLYLLQASWRVPAANCKDDVSFTKHVQSTYSAEHLVE